MPVAGFTKDRVQLEWEPGYLVTKRPLHETYLEKNVEIALSVCRHNTNTMLCAVLFNRKSA